jgi:hypothetical protein
MKLRFAIGMLVFVLLVPRVASAAVRVWDGGGVDANWMTPANSVGDVAAIPASNFPLASGGTITGTVTNATTSAPVASASVRVYSSTGLFVTSALTDGQGVYTTTGLPTGSYFLKVVPPAYTDLFEQLYDNLPMDLNADGKDDLFLHDPATGVWFQMIGDGAGNFTNAGGQIWSLGWNLYPSDFNGDGRADLLLYDPTTGAWYQARNLVNGSFTYTSGMWSPGLTIITRTPVR